MFRNRRSAQTALGILLVIVLASLLTDSLADTDGYGFEPDYMTRMEVAPGVPEGSVFAGFENNENVSLYNGNLFIVHSASPSYPLSESFAIGLQRAYSSTLSRHDEPQVLLESEACEETVEVCEAKFQHLFPECF